MNNTLDFETAGGANMDELMQYSPVDNQQTRKRSTSVTPSGRSPAGDSGQTRLRRSGSNNSLRNSATLNNNSGLPGVWDSTTKDAAIKDDWMHDGSSVNGSVLSSPSRSNKNNTILNAAQKGGLSIVAPVNWLLIFRAEVQKALDEGRSREMTLNEVTETIQKLYQSKVIANEKASRGIGKNDMAILRSVCFNFLIVAFYFAFYSFFNIL
jgi:hypothetical protein